MDAAERRIKEEQERLAAARRKLLEEDELDRSLLPLIARAGYSQTPQPLTPATPTTTVPLGNPTNGSNKDHTTLTTAVAQKRCLDTDETQGQRAKIPKLDTEAEKNPKASKAEDVGPRADPGHSRDCDRDRPGYRPRSRSFHRGGSPRRRSPSRAPHKKYNQYFGNYSDDNYGRRDSNRHNAGLYDDYRGNGKNRGWTRTPSPYGHYGRPPVADPKPIDFGGKGGEFLFTLGSVYQQVLLIPLHYPKLLAPLQGLTSSADTRFFMVKSFNEENVAMCMEDVGWRGGGLRDAEP